MEYSFKKPAFNYRLYLCHCKHIQRTHLLGVSKCEKCDCNRFVSVLQEKAELRLINKAGKLESRQVRAKMQAELDKTDAFFKENLR